jgi:Ca2+-binding EF-hand superfamily protein
MGSRCYTHADVALWRAEFGFARRQHSLAQFGYTDDELLEWRKPFDELVDENSDPATISLEGFKQMCARKYAGIVEDEELARKVQHFWDKFDRDGNRRVDFGEFIACGLLFDVDGAKEKIRRDGIDATFERYAEDGFMSEQNFFQLMCDFRFLVTTATDVRALVRNADQDCDGLVSLSDFVQWAEGSDDGLEDRQQGKRQRKARARTVPPPPPEPE